MSYCVFAQLFIFQRPVRVWLSLQSCELDVILFLVLFEVSLLCVLTYPQPGTLPPPCPPQTSLASGVFSLH